MGIEQDLAGALQDSKLRKDGLDQMDAGRAFEKRMREAGVKPNKQQFSIPLIERIGSMNALTGFAKTP